MMSNEIRTVLSASSLEGNNIVNEAEESLGHIKDLMIDTNRGNVAYAVVKFGDVLGMGGKLFFVPYQAFTIDYANKRYILSVPKETLKNAPGFEGDEWPDVTMDYDRRLYQHYGLTPPVAQA